MLSDLKIELEKLAEKLAKIRKYLFIPQKEKKLADLLKLTEEPRFWSDPRKAQEILKEISRLETEINQWKNLLREVEDALTLLNLALAEGDESIEKELAATQAKLSQRSEALEISVLLSGKYDSENAILSINAGAGGTDAQDWAQILLRMYLRWAEIKGYKVELPDTSYGEEAGIKSVTIFVNGLHAYGYLKSETGVHRLVRISPFDANKRRHTSFASVDVIPEISSEIEAELKPQDLKIDTYRASGPGGQHMQKTDSAVRITHLPTGIVAQSQADRSQHRNKETALKILKARIYERMLKEHKSRIEELKGVQKDIAWGSQIRSYVFHPYTLVKDHRTQVETGNLQSIIDGNIDLFIEAYLRQETEKDAK